MTFPATPLDAATAGAAAERLQQLRDQVARAVVGQQEVVEQVIVALLAAGHVLIEGVPGLGKTLLARALAQALSLQVARVQFTPDLMPSDITGHAVLDRSGAAADASTGAIGTLRVLRGPVFTHLLLADEINRAPAKTQAALLEVMQESQVTLEGQTLVLEPPFMVLATQNPVETEGTYPLPEAQLDRFLLKVEIGYPGAEEETAIVQRVIGAQADGGTHIGAQIGAPTGRSGNALPLEAVQPLLTRDEVLALMAASAGVRVDNQVADYAVRLTRATRDWPGLSAGAGPRGAIALARAARGAALMAGRDFTTPDDIKRFALPALRHRVLIAPDAQLEGRRVDELLAAVVESVQAPRS